MNWQIASFLVLVAVLAVGFAWYERSRPPAKVLSLVAALAALATVGRIAFAPIPNVKPTTDIALFAGYALGPVPGFAVGAVAALASNVFFGQGPWTPWQMVGWGGAGLLGGLVAKAFGRDLGRWQLAGACAIAGALFGMLLDGYQWVQGAEQDLAHYLAISATSLPYNVAHVVGNIGFCLLLGPTFVRSLARYRRRFDVRWVGSAAAALVLCAVWWLAPPSAQASAAGAVSYLRAAQNSDGGFGGARGQSSTPLHTGWVALGLAAAGVNGADVSSGGNSIVDFLRVHTAGLNDIGDLERTVLAIDSAGVDARTFAGRDLVALIERKRSSNGSWRGNNGWTAFGVLALKATGGSGIGRSARWLARQQNARRRLRVPAERRERRGRHRRRAAGTRRGGHARLEGGAQGDQVPARRSEPGRRLQPAARHRPRTRSPRRGPCRASSPPAAARPPSSAAATQPLAFLRTLQASDGSFRYSRTSSQTPVWVTAQALDAVEGKPFPLSPAPRAAKPKPNAGGLEPARAREEARREAEAEVEAQAEPRSSGPAGAAPAGDVRRHPDRPKRPDRHRRHDDPTVDHRDPASGRTRDAALRRRERHDCGVGRRRPRRRGRGAGAMAPRAAPQTRHLDSPACQPPWPCAASRSVIGPSRRSRASISRWRRGSSSGCSGRTAPASRRS